MIILNEMLTLTTFLFFTGMIGVALNRKNIIITMMSIELMLLAVNLNFLIFSQQFDDIVGQIFVLFILTIAASESAIGLAILSLYNSTKNTITYDVLKNMHHHSIYPDKKAYSYLLPERIKKAAGLLFRQIEERIPNYFIFFAGTMFLLVCSFFYIYVVSLESLSLKDLINSLNAKNQLLEQQIQDLVDLLNKLRAARYEKPKDFMGPYQKSFCAIACVVVALGVCAYLWPAPFVAIKKGIFAYFFGSGDDSNTGSGDDSSTGFGADKKTFFDDDIQTYTTPATDGSGVEWMVKVSNEKLSEILIKTCDSPAFIPINNYLDIMDRCVSIAVADPNHPFYRDFPGLLSTAIAGLSQAPLMPL